MNILKNQYFELSFLPDFGCHWTHLRIQVKREWLDLLYPVPDVKRPELGSFMMAPWSNRIPGGDFQFEGKPYRVKVNFPDGTAIHGDVRTRPWKVKTSSENKFEAVLDSEGFNDFNFPFALVYEHSLELKGPALRVGLFIENVESQRAPVGFGFHPFFKRRLTEADQDVMLILPAGKVSPDEKCIPTGPPIPVSGAVDLREPRYLGNPDLDHCYTQLADNKIQLIYPATKVEASLTLDPVYSHVVVYAPAANEGGPKEYVSVEPVTHVNNGFNLHAKGWKGTGVKVLEPGERWGGYWTLTFKPHLAD